VPYSPEYKLLSAGASVLPELARATGGREVADPLSTFAPFPQPAAHTQPAWPPLLLAAALLFPLDVAVRRLRLTRADALRFLAWLREALGRTRPEASRGRAPRALDALFAARERARTRPARAAPPAPHPAEARPEPRGGEQPTPPAAPPSSEAVTEHLKRAKERARRTRRS
jgi:hypothetical protein